MAHQPSIPRDALRVRRYLDDELVDVIPIFMGDASMLAEAHAEWANMAVESGRTYRVVIDDPAGDIPEVVLLEGGPTPDVEYDPLTSWPWEPPPGGYDPVTLQQMRDAGTCTCARVEAASPFCPVHGD